MGGWLGGEKSKLKLNSAQLELELGLSLAKTPLIVDTLFRDSARKPLGPISIYRLRMELTNIGN